MIALTDYTWPNSDAIYSTDCEDYNPSNWTIITRTKGPVAKMSFKELARLEHIIRMKQDQKEWWHDGLQNKVVLYNNQKLRRLFYRKMLHCNRFD